MARPDSTTPAPAGSENRRQDVGIDGLDIRRRSIHQSITQFDFGPVTEAALAEHLNAHMASHPIWGAGGASRWSWSAAPLTASTAAAPAPTAMEMFRARAAAGAHLYRVGELDLHDAMDALQEHAERHGLVRGIGQDAEQWIISEAFRSFRAGRVP